MSASRPTPSTAPPKGWPYLRVFFSCANSYQRVYRRPEAKEYLARCPQCGLCKRFQVGNGGSSQRFFELTCKG